MTGIGWCPGGRPVADMLTMYPGTTVVRIFVGPGDPLPTWDGPVLGPAVAAGAVVHVSFKTNGTAEVRAWAAKKPAGLLLLLLTFAHEPEQQKYGDPTVEVFRTRWAELVAGFVEHPMRDEILLAPTYTRFWWQAHPGDLRWLFAVPGVDAIAWDVYNNGGTYRTPDDLLSIPRQIAARTGLPYLVAELGAVRVPGDTGAGRQAWMRAMVSALRADGALTACWFHKDEWDLTRADSVPEQQTWRELTQEASMDWYLAPSLKVLRDEINARWPNRDKTSDGSIGDAAHQAGTSDHNPNVRGSVNAIDVDEDGIDPYEVIAAFERHPSAHYWIYERQIADKDDGWRRRTYYGTNPHDKHAHLSIRQTSTAEQDTSPWGLLEDVVTPEDINRIAYATKQLVLSDGGMQQLFTRVYNLGVGQAALTAAVKALPGVVAGEGTSAAELAAALDALPDPQPLDVQALALALAPLLPAGTVITDDQLERVLRTVLGSVDNPAS